MNVSYIQLFYPQIESQVVYSYITAVSQNVLILPFAPRFAIRWLLQHSYQPKWQIELGSVCFRKICRPSPSTRRLRVVSKRIKEGGGINLTNKLSRFRCYIFETDALHGRTFSPLHFLPLHIFHAMESLPSIWTDFFPSLVCFD